MNTPKHTPSYPHIYVFKAMWPSTAMKIIVSGRNLKHAKERAWGTVSRMEGGMDCLSVELIEQRK